MVVVTEWVQYRTLDLERIKREMAQPVVVDLRNIYRPEDMAAHGFTYESVGRAAEPGREPNVAVIPRACGVSSTPDRSCESGDVCVYWITPVRIGSGG